MISCEVAESSAPVGSSARTSFGLAASARAIATRCCSPPDISDGRCSDAVREPDPLEVLPRRRRAASCARRPGSRGEGDVLGRGLERDQVERLEDEPDELPAVNGRACVSERSFMSRPSSV